MMPNIGIRVRTTLPFEPGYRYKIKVIAYHESSGQWREWVKIDNGPRHLIKYNACEPETLEFWIPPAFYKDGVIEVLIDRITGPFASIGPMWVYRYEYEEGEGGASGGPMAYEPHSFSRNSFLVMPNPFANELNITAQLADCGQQISLRIYDIAGRLVKKLYDGDAEHNFSVKWHGEDENGRKLSPGVYFLKFTNANTNETFCHKIVKVE